MSWIGLVMKKSIFKYEKRPTSVSKEGLFSVSLSYPNQWLRYSNQKISWNQEVFTNESYAMKFYMSTLEIMEYRNKRSKPCSNNWRQEDHEIRNEIIRRVKCYPPYWKNQQKNDKFEYPTCAKKDMRMIYMNVSCDNYIEPCRTISKASWYGSEVSTNSYDDKFEGGYPGRYILMYFSFPRKMFKEIYLVQSFTLETMIGNGGGYIGLCLGYSFLQLPAFLHTSYRRLIEGFKQK